MKPVSLVFALVFTAVGSVLAQNDTADAGTGDVNGGGNGGQHKGHGKHHHLHHHHKHKGKGKGDDDDDSFKKPNAGSTLQRCTTLQHLNALIDTAANDTRLQEIFHGNATREARFRERADRLQNATTPEGALFQDLQSNATLLATCDAIFATESSDAACKRLFQLEDRAAVVANATELQEAARGNSTRAQKLQAQAAAAQPELAALQANATLLEFCAMFQTRADCRTIQKLEADVNLARNATRLNQTLDGNTTRIAEFQTKAAKALTRLDLLLNNATLVSICRTEIPSIIDLANETLTSTNTVTTSSAAHSTAGSVLSLVVFLMLGLFLL